MEGAMKESSLKVKDKDMVLKFGQMVENMMENGQTVKCMVKVYFIQLMAKYKVENGKMEKECNGSKMSEQNQIIVDNS